MKIRIHCKVASPCRPPLSSFSTTTTTISPRTYPYIPSRSISQPHTVRSRYDTSSTRHVRLPARSHVSPSLTRTITTATSSNNPPAALINDLPRGFQEVVVDFNDGTDAIRYPSFWLRDHCRCHECCHSQTKQRQLDTFALDPDTKALDAEIQTSTTSDSGTLPDPESSLKITWSGSPSHTSIYPVSWLKQQTPFSSAPPSPRQNPRGKWKHVSPSAPSYPSVDYHSVMTTDEGLSQLLSRIRTYGFAFIPNTPCDTLEPTKQLAERIGTTIRHTHYGGFWEVVSEANPIDTAYTNLFLPNHTDNTYFTDPCGLQMFHCLSHHPSSSSSSSSSTTTPSSSHSLGGQSTLIDGFAAASFLHRHHPNAYRLLSTIPIISHASGDSHAGPFLSTALSTLGHPVFTHNTSAASGPAYHHPRSLSQIRWNNADRAAETVFPNHATMMGWYEAARLWEGLVNPGKPRSSHSHSDSHSHSHSSSSARKAETTTTPQFEITIKLTPGTTLVFDNWRVLHGRKSFEGVRRLCGAYIGMDDFLAKGRGVDERLGARYSEEEGEEA